MDDVLSGRVAWIFEDHFDTDLIVGIKNIASTDLNQLLLDVMHSYDKDLKASIRKGDMLVGGTNFGYGHPHPQAMMVMRALGIRAVIAESFAFPFYRSELASGMVLVRCPGISKKVSRWDEVKLILQGGILENMTTGEVLVIDPIPPVAIEMMQAGGVVNYLKIHQDRRAPTFSTASPALAP